MAPASREALSLYRRHYRPSERHPQPQATICVWALAADSAEEARFQATTREYWRTGFDKGLRLPLASPEAASRHPYTPSEQSMIASLRANALVGTGAEVAEKLRALARRLELEEIVINTWTFDPAVRQHSYTLLARAFGFMSILRTSRLVLRELDHRDAAFILELLNEPGFLRFIGDKGVRTLEDACRYLDRGPRASYARHGYGLNAVCLPDGTPLGLCGLVRRDGFEHADLGFAFLARGRGQGYAAESARAVLQQAFGHF